MEMKTDNLCPIGGGGGESDVIFKNKKVLKFVTWQCPVKELWLFKNQVISG